jgi:hypothetical protein
VLPRHMVACWVDVTQVEPTPKPAAEVVG